MQISNYKKNLILTFKVKNIFITIIIAIIVIIISFLFLFFQTMKYMK